MAYTSWSVSFGEQPSASKWNILGTNDASFNDGTGIADSKILPKHLLTGTGSSWALQSWTPSWTNLTAGNGTTVAKYIQVGKIVFFRLSFTLGSTSSITALVKASAPITASSSMLDLECGTGTANDTGVGAYSIAPRFSSGAGASTIEIVSMNASASRTTHAGFTNTDPFTWGTGDSFQVQGWYEAA